MNNDILTVLGIGTLCAAAYAVYKVSKIDSKITATTDAIASGIDIPVDEPIVKSAVEKAINREVSEAAAKATERTSQIIANDISKEVRKEVEKAHDDIAAEVQAEIKKKIGAIDISREKNNVLNEAKEMAKDKFSADLSSVLDNYNESLQNVSTIYKSISDSVYRNNSRDNSTPLIFKI